MTAVRRIHSWYISQYVLRQEAPIAIRTFKFVGMARRGMFSAGDLIKRVRARLPAHLTKHVIDPKYNEETGVKNYVLPILQELGLKNASYEFRLEDGRPDVVWADSRGVSRLVGEFKKPWDSEKSSKNPRAMIELALTEARQYNSTLMLRYVLASDCRFIILERTVGSGVDAVELDLLDLAVDPVPDAASESLVKLAQRLYALHAGEWNEVPSTRDLRVPDVFEDFLVAARLSLLDDLLPSIEAAFAENESRFLAFKVAQQELVTRARDAQNHAVRRPGAFHAEAVERLANDLRFDYVGYFAKPPKDVNKEACLADLANFHDALIALRTQSAQLEREYADAIEWDRRWNQWLDLTGKAYDGASPSEKAAVATVFKLQTLHVFFNRILLIRILEDMGIIGQVISDGFISAFDRRVHLKVRNKFEEPLATASKQAAVVYASLFSHDTPHDWYRYDEDVLRTILRRFDNFNFGHLDRDIIGEMYQKCLDKQRRKELGSIYTPREAIAFLLDAVGFSPGKTNLKKSEERVLDPACGSGAFLIEIVARILDDFISAGVDLTKDDDLAKVIETINKKVIAFDVDPYAVQLAQSNLIIKILQERQKQATHTGASGVLQIPPFSIFETDSLLTRKYQGNDHQERFYRAREKISERLPELIAAKEGTPYRLVIGNPPYIRSHNQDEVRTREYKELHDTFNEAQADIFLPFVEQGIQWLENGGKLAFVISNQLLVSEASQTAMKYILDNCAVELVVDLTRAKIFGVDINVFPILIVLRKEANQDTRRATMTKVIKIFVKGEEDNTWAAALGHAGASILPHYPAPAFDFATEFESAEFPNLKTSDTFTTYAVRQDRFEADRWGTWTSRLVLNYNVDDELWSIAKQLEDSTRFVKLEKLCKLEGDDNEPGRGEEPRFFKKYVVADASKTPVIGGGNIQPFYLGDIPEDVNEYVDLSAIKADPSSKVSKAKLKAFEESTRLAYRETASRLTFVVDDPLQRVTFYSKQAYFLILRDAQTPLGPSPMAEAIDPHYLCALLNSEVLDFYYKSYYEHKGFRHAPAIRCRTSYIGHLPILLPTAAQKAVLVDISVRLHAAQRLLRGAQIARDQYHASQVAGGRLRPLHETIKQVLRSRPGIRISSLALSRDGARLTLNRNVEIEAYSESEAEAIEAYLSAFGQEETGKTLPEFTVPADLVDFMGSAEKLAQDISNIEQQVALLLNGLEAYVYEIYGLTAHRERIQDYLRGFLKVIK